MPTIGFVSQKGGVGKTCCAAAVAGILAQKHKVCLVDVDEQASAAFAVGATPPAERLPLRDAILERRVVDWVFETPVPNLCVVPADPSVNEANFVSVDMRERLLEFALKPLQHYFEYVVIDTPSGLGLWTWNTVYIADLLILPTDADEAAKRCLGQTLEWVSSIIRRFRPEVCLEEFYRVLVTMENWDDRLLFAKLKASLEAEHGAQTFQTRIQRRTAVKQARDLHMPIVEFAKRDRSEGSREAVKEFVNLVKEIIAHEESRAAQPAKNRDAVGA